MSELIEHPGIDDSEATDISDFSIMASGRKRTSDSYGNRALRDMSLAKLTSGVADNDWLVR